MKRPAEQPRSGHAHTSPSHNALEIQLHAALVRSVVKDTRQAAMVARAVRSRALRKAL